MLRIAPKRREVRALLGPFGFASPSTLTSFLHDDACRQANAGKSHRRWLHPCPCQGLGIPGKCYPTIGTLTIEKQVTLANHSGELALSGCHGMHLLDHNANIMQVNKQTTPQCSDSTAFLAPSSAGSCPLPSLGEATHARIRTHTHAYVPPHTHTHAWWPW